LDRQPRAEFDLRGYVRVLWKRKLYALAGLVLCVVPAVAYTATRTPMYESTATLFVGQQQISLQDVARGLASTSLSAQLVKSYADILASRTTAERAVAENGLALSPGAVAGGLTIEPVVDTQILKVTFRSSDPALAARVANAVSTTFVKQIQELAVPPPLPTTTTGAPAATSAPTTNEASPPAVTVSVVDAARPPSVPASPNRVRDVALGIVLGGLAGVGLAFGADHLDSSVKGREDTERLGLPVLGVIPKMHTGGAEVYIERDPQDVAAESFRKLRTSIGFLGVDRPIKTLMVTSPIAGEGKTTVATNLAVAYAQAANRTLLLEADLRRPSLHRLFGMSGTDGLTTAIIGTCSISRAMRDGVVPNLQCIVAGAIPPNPVELLESAQMAHLLELVASQFDMVVIDAPPIMPVADAIALGRRCDGVVVVARSGATPRERLVETIGQVERSGAKFLGTLLNGAKPSDSPYEYEYYYAYRSAPPRGDSVTARGERGVIDG